MLVAAFDASLVEVPSEMAMPAPTPIPTVTLPNPASTRIVYAVALFAVTETMLVTAPE